jgi:hypothetical protein
LTLTILGEGESHWEFRWLRCISWKGEIAFVEARIRYRHDLLTFKKRSTFLATSVASLALVIGEGLRLQSFVLIYADGQTRGKKANGCTNLLGP